MHNKLVILAAGTSSRMKRSMESSDPSVKVKNISKALITLGNKNKNIIDYLLENAGEAGYTEIYLVVGSEYDQFRSIYGDQIKNNRYHGLNIHYAIQHIPKDRTEPFGTADAVFQALEQYPELKENSFTVCNSDNLYSVNALKGLLNDRHPNAMIRYDIEGLKFEIDKISKFAILSVDEDGYLIDIIEKPKSFEHETKFWVSMNIFKFHGPSIYPYLKHCPVNVERDEKELPTAILTMCHEHEKVLFTIPFSEHVPDLTQMDDIDKFNDYLNDRTQT